MVTYGDDDDTTFILVDNDVDREDDDVNASVAPNVVDDDD